MKFSPADTEMLREIGYSLDDIEEIKRYRYRFIRYDAQGNPETLSAQKARKILSTREYLTEIGRSAFHVTSWRGLDNFEGILTESL